MKLVKPNIKYAESWMEALREFELEERDGFWNIPEKPKNFEEYLERIENHLKGVGLPKNWVKSSTFWLIDNEKFIGHVNIRHELTAELEKLGGNIGYYIRPSERQKGYGRKILQLALSEAERLGLKKVLITCDVDNIFSQRVAIFNGGQFVDDVEVNGRKIKRFLIDLKD